jgi:hypothetical protein
VPTLIAVGAYVLAFALAFAVAYALVNPLRDNPVGYDTAASVLYFQRIVHGTLLEVPYAATPKPLATLVDGLLYSVFGWRAVSLVAVASFAGVVALGSMLARRVGGTNGWVAAGFAFVALLGSEPLLLDASFAYAASWAALGCLVAGFAITARRPNYPVAGIALGLATLARLETIVVVVGAVGIIAAARLLAPVTGRLPSGNAWWVALGLGAIPVMLIHDWRLAGDPFYWADVSVRFSRNHPDAVMSPIETFGWLVRYFEPLAVTVVLAIVGVAVLAVRRLWAVTLGLGLLLLGVPALLLVLAARDTYVSSRYIALADLALVIPAAVGIAAVSLPELASPLRRATRSSADTIARLGRPVLGAGLAMILALALRHPFAPADTITRRIVFDQRAVARNVEAAVPILRASLATPGPIDGSKPRIVAPGLWNPRLIVDLGLRIPEVGPAQVTADGTSFLPGAFAPGQVVFHDRIGDGGVPAFSALESAGTVDAGGYRLSPVASNPTAGWWVLRVVAGP